MFARLLISLFLLNGVSYARESFEPFRDSLIRKIIRISSLNQGSNFLLTLSNRVRAAELNFYLGSVYHQMALISPESFASNSVFHLRKALEHQTNALYLAWLGSALGLEAKVFFLKGEERNSALRVEESGILLDRAVRLDPNEMLIRVLRLKNGLFTGTFSIYKRYHIVENDVVFLLWKTDRMNREEQAEIYELAGELAFALGRSRKKVFYYLEKAINVAPDSVFADRAMRYWDQIK